MTGKQLQALFETRRDAAIRIIDDSIHDIADEIEMDMYDMCPVDTGTLRDSIDTDDIGTGSYVHVGITVGTDYADDVEFGTSRQQAQPFIRPAYAKHVKELNGIKKKLRGNMDD